ncbi:MAG: hypothetical protein KDD69_06745 [Bdellovibrionales bacterium]|nr:hypothetical protein [Bdellovibrionales bacterium]
MSPTFLSLLRDAVFLFLGATVAAAEAILPLHGDRLSSAALGALVFWAAGGFATAAAARTLLLLHFVVFCAALAAVSFVGVLALPVALYALARMCLLTFDAISHLHALHTPPPTRRRALVLAILLTLLFVAVNVWMAEPVWLVDTEVALHKQQSATSDVAPSDPQSAE